MVGTMFIVNNTLIKKVASIITNYLQLPSIN